MIAIVLTFFLVIGIIGFRGNGDTCGAIACAAIILIVWLFHYWNHLDAKAWVNKRNYWAMDGKERAMARRRWEMEAQEEETVKRAPGEVVEEDNTKQKEDVCAEKCAKCRAEVNEVGRKKYSDGTVFIQYRCPVCGEMKLKKVS